MMNCPTATELVSVAEFAEDEKSGVQPKPERHPVTSRLRRGDESDIEWFTSRGESLFHRSTFGAQLERAEMESHITERCLKCDGDGFDAKDGTCTGCRGMGFVPRRLGQAARAQKMSTQTKACPNCGTPGKRRQLKGACETCSGNGYIEADFAIVKSNRGGEEPSYTPDDASLQRYAVVSRRLSMTERRNRNARVVLEAFHGLPGLKWASTSHGRLYSLVPFTVAGGTLIARDSNLAELTPHALFENIVAAQKGKDGGRGKLIATGLTQAAELYRSACSTWNAAVYP